MNIVERNIDKLIKLCKKYKVTKLYVFGSVITEKFTKESDIDLLVTFDDIDLQNYADNYFDLKFSLEDLFKRKIDLLEEKAIKNPFFKKSINNSKELIYG
jgi:predicted nucleotidyltransferase